MPHTIIEGVRMYPFPIIVLMTFFCLAWTITAWRKRRLNWALEEVSSDERVCRLLSQIRDEREVAAHEACKAAVQAAEQHRAARASTRSFGRACRILGC